MRELKGFIRGNSIDNLRVGKVIAKVGTKHVVRVGITEIVSYFTGSANVGDIVTIECPDGLDNKGYILGPSPIVLAEGDNVII